eukprot:g499.t1
MRRWAVEAKKESLRRMSKRLSDRKTKLSRKRRQNMQLAACASMAEGEEEETRKRYLELTTDLASQNKLLDDVIGLFGKYVALKRVQLATDVVGHATANALHLAAVAALRSAKEAVAASAVADSVVESCRRLLHGLDDIRACDEVVREAWRHFRLSEDTTIKAPCMRSLRALIFQNRVRLTSIFRYYAAFDCCAAVKRLDQKEETRTTHRMVDASTQTMSIEGLKRLLTDTKLLLRESGAGVRWIRIELLFRTMLKSQRGTVDEPSDISSNSSRIGLLQFVDVLMKLAHICFYRSSLDTMERENIAYERLLHDGILEDLGLKDIGIDDYGGTKQSLRSAGESLSLPPGLSAFRLQLKGRAMVEALRVLLDRHVLRHAMRVDVDRHLRSVFGDFQIKRVVFQHAETLRRIFGYYAEDDKMMTFEGLRRLLEDCTNFEKTSTTTNANSSMLNVLMSVAYCRRPRPESDFVHTSEIEEEEEEDGFGIFSDPAVDAGDARSTFAIDFANFVEIVVLASECFEREPFVSTKTKLLLLFKQRLFSYCKMKSPADVSVDINALQQLFVETRVKETRAVAEKMRAYHRQRVEFVRENPYGIYKPPPNLAMKRAEEKLLSTIMKIALSEDCVLKSKTADRLPASPGDASLTWRLKSAEAPPGLEHYFD